MPNPLFKQLPADFHTFRLPPAALSLHDQTPATSSGSNASVTSNAIATPANTPMQNAEAVIDHWHASAAEQQRAGQEAAREEEALDDMAVWLDQTYLQEVAELRQPVQGNAAAAADDAPMPPDDGSHATITVAGVNPTGDCETM